PIDGQVTDPVIKKVAEPIFRYMSVPPDVPSYAPQYTVKNEKPRITVAAVYVRRRSLQPVSTVVVHRRYSGDGVDFGDITIPDFHGKSLRQVTEECLKAGLRLQSAGSGAAVEQMPPPGASVRVGAR